MAPTQECTIFSSKSLKMTIDLQFNNPCNLENFFGPISWTEKLSSASLTSEEHLMFAWNQNFSDLFWECVSFAKMAIDWL